MNPSTNSQSPPRSDPHRDPFSRRGESSKGQGRSTHDRAASKETMKSLSNLTLPHDWYPEARSMKRKIIMHVGPTNSGKTHQALQRLQEAESGIYCGPLRLLAWEVKEKLANDLNIPCNLLTGQEVERMDGANHVSCTVEMTNTSEPVDVCVIDEVQMIDSSDRGSAWTRALLGVPAKEIHVCGSPNLVNIVRELASVTGDAVEVNKYERLSPLKFGEPLQRGWKDVERGDCLVAFSRKDLYSIKRAVESSTEHKCCIIYGSLPPEVRKLQAELFNDPDSGYDVLVASDAIGMGLNLNMRRVIFGTIAKFDGTEVRDLLPSEALQIGGRAGRFNTEWSTGYVTTLFPDDYEDLKEIFATPIDPIKRAGLTPNRDVIQKIHERRPDLELNEILAFLSEYATLDELYFMCDLEDVFEICQLLAPVRGLEMDTLYNVCQAPVKIREKSHMRALRSFITDYVQHGVVTLDGDGSRDSFSSLPLKNPPATTEQIRTVENHWGVMDLYIWLSHRFPHAFVDQELATERRNQMADWIDVGLQLIETTSFEDRSKQRKKRKKKKKKKNPGYRNRR